MNDQHGIFSMSDGDFEFREDFARSKSVAGRPVTLCAVKWEAAKACIDFVRQLVEMEVSTNGKAPALARLLDQAGITPDFTPSPSGQ
jgi:hypothetical protein